MNSAKKGIWITPDHSAEQAASCVPARWLSDWPSTKLLPVSDSIQEVQAKWPVVRDLSPPMGLLESAGFRIFQTHTQRHFSMKVALHAVVVHMADVNWSGFQGLDFVSVGWATERQQPCSDGGVGERMVMVWLLSVFSQWQCQSCLQCCLFVDAVVLTKCKKQTNQQLLVTATHTINP